MRRVLLVVGSGPAGVACAWALAARGLRPVVVDGGRRLEPERAVAVQRSLRRDEADASVIAELERSFPVEVGRLPLKPAFGSFFPYALDEPQLPTGGNVGVVGSLAFGGLSNVWGASVLPYIDRDLDAWPIRTSHLAPYYRSTFKFVPLAGDRDQLEELFPLYGEPEPLEPTRQIAALLRRLREVGPELRRAGAIAGRARLAVASGASALATPCRHTGLCMFGCPYGSIYNAAATLGELVAAGRAEYRPGWVVERLTESHDGVTVQLQPLGGGGRETLSAHRVFLAAGVLGSTRILLESLEAYDRQVRVLASAYFTVPLLTMRRPARVGRGLAGNTLAQVFLDFDPDPSLRGVHLQLYGYNDLMLRALSARVRLSEAATTRLLQPLLGRLLFAGGYLHSDDSPSLSASLVPTDSRSSLVLSAGDEAAVSEKIAAVVEKLRGLRRLIGTQPLRGMLQIWPPGKSFHVGGSFPMREHPGEFDSDLLGRPTGFRRVHVVDASVLPSLPPTTITLAVMANAQRIAAEHDQD